jgi:hypothetical protein
MNEPVVTVIMSVYSGEKYLREAIYSILGQAYYLILNMDILKFILLFSLSMLLGYAYHIFF